MTEEKTMKLPKTKRTKSDECKTNDMAEMLADVIAAAAPIYERHGKQVAAIVLPTSNVKQPK